MSLTKKQKNSRLHSKKALTAIEAIQEKFPNGISDVTGSDEFKKSWLQIKIQQFRECIKETKFLSKPSWWETMRITRNETAHQKEDFSNEEFSDLADKLFSNIGKIFTDLNANIKRYRHDSKKKRKFENFAPATLGSESERKQLVDAMEDMIAPIEPKDVKIDFPKNQFAQNAEKMLLEILSKSNMKNYLPLHEGLSENIQTDVLEWILKSQRKLEKENPFMDEAIFINRQKKLSAEEIALDLSAENSKIKYHYKRLPSISDSKRGNIVQSNLDFDFYAKSFSAQKVVKKSENGEEKISWKSAEELETLRRNFISDMEKILIERKNEWEMERIDALRKTFLEKLYQKIQKFMRLEKLLSPLIKSFGRLWDLSEHIFETSGFEILDQFAKLLEQDESLQELADLLGKQSRAQSLFEKELRDKVVIRTEWHPKSAYRGEINGLRYSNDVSAALPTEVAMLKNPAAKKLFQLKFAQKQLLSFDYQNDKAESKEGVEQEEVSVEKKEPKGPVIICVDTSGSMHGTPENIAKTITFALAKIAVSEKRKCYLISFSTNIETLDLSDFKTGDAISKLVRFLQMSFNGGTDARPALEHSVEMLHKDGYKNADVLMISDFVMGTLPGNLVKSIEAEKENGTNFYSLVIGSSGNQETIKCFNRNWLYNTSDPHAQRHLVEQLHELKNRKIDKT